VAYEITGSSQFIPVAEAGAVPHTGTLGKLGRTEEIRVEILYIGRKVTKAAVEASKMWVESLWSGIFANRLAEPILMKFAHMKSIKLRTFKQRQCANTCQTA
jgi:hypothetical protein